LLILKDNKYNMHQNTDKQNGYLQI